MLGAEHPDIATSLNNLAALYSDQGRYTEAEPLFLEALEMAMRLLGAKHPNTQTFLENYRDFFQQVLRENRQDNLSNQRNLLVILITSDMEKSS